MNLRRYQDKPVRLTTVYGDVFEGQPEHFDAGYGLYVCDREEEGLQFGVYLIFKSEIRKIEPLDPKELCGFFSAEYVPEGVRELYRDLRQVWCAETCAPRMREQWSPENPSFGQCSITAFLVQELFGGTVYGIQRPDESVHCYNEIEDSTFDLTSEQFGDEDLDYFGNAEQQRETHFAKAEKQARYELLKQRLEAYRRRKNAEGH